MGADTQPPTLSVTAPAAGEVAAAGAGHPYVIRWTVTPGTEPIHQFDRIFSPDDGFTTSAIAECAHLPASATSCQWNNPGGYDRLGREGVTMQYRDQTGGQSARVAASSAESGPIRGTAPGWVRLTRSGTTFVGEWSTDGVNSTQVGEAGPLAMDATIYIGVAVTSHAARSMRLAYSTM